MLLSFIISARIVHWHSDLLPGVQHPRARTPPEQLWLSEEVPPPPRREFVGSRTWTHLLPHPASHRPLLNTGAVHGSHIFVIEIKTHPPGSKIIQNLAPFILFSFYWHKDKDKDFVYWHTWYGGCKWFLKLTLAGPCHICLVQGCHFFSLSDFLFAGFLYRLALPDPLIVLQGCQIENLKEVDRCQNQYMMLLFRYLIGYLYLYLHCDSAEQLVYLYSDCIHQ